MRNNCISARGCNTNMAIQVRNYIGSPCTTEAVTLKMGMFLDHIIHRYKCNTFYKVK